jgi:glyoxylase-like metal-dependent hydrolase (beta-lactamase superfamily II)
MHHDSEAVLFELPRTRLVSERLRALETPGHTAESISLVVYDLDRSATEPQAALTELAENSRLK